MADQSQFNLEREILAWRATLTQQKSLTNSTIDELESHLRDAYDELARGPLSGEEAFLVACRRLGHPTALDREFSKVSPPTVWPTRVRWMFAGYLFFLAVGYIAELASRSSALLALHLGTNAYQNAAAASGVLLTIWVLLFLWIYRTHSHPRPTWQSHIAGYLQSRPATAIGLTLACFGLVSGLSLLAQVSLIRGGALEYAQTILVSQRLTQLVVSVILVIACLIGIKRLKQFC